MSFARWAMVAVPLVLLLGFLSGRSVASGEQNEWYRALAKPALTPPGWVFPVAWTTLYILLGLALALILNARGARGRGLALALFGLGIALNLAWSPLFFRFHLILPALVLIAAMFLVALATTLAMARISRVAAWLLVPYMAWLGFAAGLNFDIWRLNPAADAFQQEI